MARRGGSPPRRRVKSDIQAAGERDRDSQRPALCLSRRRVVVRLSCSLALQNRSIAFVIGESARQIDRKNIVFVQRTVGAQPTISPGCRRRPEWSARTNGNCFDAMGRLISSEGKKLRFHENNRANGKDNKSRHLSVALLTPGRPLKSPLCPQRHRRPANLLWPSVPPDYASRQIFVTFRTKKLRRKQNGSAHWPIPVACLRILNDMATQPIAMGPTGCSTLQGQFSVLSTAYAVLRTRHPHRTRHPQTPRTVPRRCIIACNDEPMTDKYYRPTANDF